MWKNYLNVVLRGIWNRKAFSAINIFGLAIGISCCLLILIYVQYEFSYDQHNENYDRIYRISVRGVLNGNEINAAVSSFPMAAALVSDYPEIESSARLRPFYSSPLVSLDNIVYQENKVFHADPSLFDVFSFTFLEGDSSSALNEPNTIVITSQIAQKYFNRLDVVGESLTLNNQENYMIVGVIESVPANSHFHPDVLVSFTSDEQHDSTFWVSNSLLTYFVLRPGVSEDEFEIKVQGLVTKYVAPQLQNLIGIPVEQFFAEGGEYSYDLQALSQLHLFSDKEGELEAPGNAQYVYTFFAVAIFVLLLACINFMNLSTARSANRAKEIGVRKVMGAYRGQLIGQFLAESILISFIALCIALPLVALLLPAFNALTDKSMSLDILANAQAIALLIALMLVVGIISGSYPALYLSKFHPQEVLKGKHSGGLKSAWFRSGLVILQFTISIALVSATIIVYEQLNYMRSKSLGFEKEQLLVIQRANSLGEQLESFKEVISTFPNVVNVTSSAHVPGEGVEQNVYTLEGDTMDDVKAIWAFSVGYDYMETMGFEFLEGRSFSETFGSDDTAYIINERAAKEFEISNPTQHRIMESGPEGIVTGSIIGMVKDFHFQSLHQEIRPVLFRIRGFARHVVVRVSPNDVQQTISEIESTWSTMTNGEPFEYSFLEEDFNQLHQGEQRMGAVFTGFSLLAIAIACLGLYGLASFTTEQRTKEIGIRKTLGASVGSLVLLVSKEFMILVMAAFLIAIPVTWLGMNQWLQLFSYRIDIPLSSFFIAGSLGAIIAFITVSYQSSKAALTNPSLALRDE